MKLTASKRNPDGSETETWSLNEWDQANVARVAQIYTAFGVTRSAQSDYVEAHLDGRWSDADDLVWEAIQRGWQEIRLSPLSDEAKAAYDAAADAAGVR